MYHLVEILKQKWAIVRIEKANAILKHPINKLLPTEFAYHDINQTNKAKEQKLKRAAAVIDQLKRKTWLLTAWAMEGRRAFENCKNLLVRFNKTQEIFPRVNWVSSILGTKAATSASSERVNSKESVAKGSCSISAASYAQITQLSVEIT